jgi:hypothetical protein
MATKGKAGVDLMRVRCTRHRAGAARRQRIKTDRSGYQPLVARAQLVAAAVAPQALPVTALLVLIQIHRGEDGRNATVSLARCDSYHFFNPEWSNP